MTSILSIQSHVAYGHVGNAAAVFALQRLGVEAWPVHTVQFSNHTGYGSWKGRVFDGAAVSDVVQGIDERGALARCDGVLSGYMGDLGIGVAILDAVARAKRANPAARYCCDPVIGDAGRGIYVREGIEDFMRERALPAADIATPNQFELERFSGCAVVTLTDAKGAADALHARGPRVLLVTSLRVEDTPADAIDVLASDGGRRWRVRTPRLSHPANGAGDTVAALFFAHYLRSGEAAEALSRAVSSVFGILKRTAEAGERELALVAAQDEIVAPTWVFVPEAV